MSGNCPLLPLQGLRESTGHEEGGRPCCSLIYEDCLENIQPCNMRNRDIYGWNFPNGPHILRKNPSMWEAGWM